MNIVLHCDLCSKKKTLRAVADGWKVRHDEIDIERKAFCPDHAAVMPFFAAQCPGCVAGWPDCPLHESFAYRHSRAPKLSEQERKYMLAGGCPRRVNGTFSADLAEGIRIAELNISDPAPKESAAALLAAIDAYVKEFGT